jgi:uncharacterized OB-fold protein
MSGLTAEAYRRALQDGQLCVAICASCGGRQALPADTCFACGSDNLRVDRHSGAGRVFSWVINHYAFAADLSSETPYTVVLVTLEGGGRVYGRFERTPDGPPIDAHLPVVLDIESTARRGYPVYNAG